MSKKKGKKFNGRSGWSKKSRKSKIRESENDYLERFMTLASEQQWSNSLHNRTLNANVIDSAAQDHEYSDYWSHATTETVSEFLTPARRRIVNARCRQLYVNDGYSFGGAGTLSTHVIGRSALLRLGSESHHFSCVKRWERWCKLTQFWQKMRLGVSMMSPDGEFFLRKCYDKDVPDTHFRIMEIDPMRVQTPPWREFDENISDGIEYSDPLLRKPLYYNVKKIPINPTYKTSIDEYERIPASQIIHFSEAAFPEQLRGLPLMQSVLRVISGRQSYNYSVIDCADSAARPSVIISNNLPLPSIEDTEELDNIRRLMTSTKREFELPRGAALAVNNGTVSQLKAEQPTEAHAGFTNTLCNEQASTAQMPTNLFKHDSSATNYSSGQLDHKTFFRVCEIHQANLESGVFDETFEEWLILDATVNEDSARVLQEADNFAPNVNRTWYYKPIPHSDPVKEWQAKQIRLQSGLATEEDILLEEGIDPDKFFAQRQREALRRRELNNIEGNVNNENR